MSNVTKCNLLASRWRWCQRTLGEQADHGYHSSTDEGVLQREDAGRGEKDLVTLVEDGEYVSRLSGDDGDGDVLTQVSGLTRSALIAGHFCLMLVRITAA